jgi:hypothetical protein
MDLSQLGQVAPLVGIVIAVFGVFSGLYTIVRSVQEYRHQGVMKRVESFMDMRRRIRDSDLFKRLMPLVERDDPQLKSVNLQEKRDLLGLFEELALMMNSGLIRREVVHYMFGSYALWIRNSKNFWFRPPDYKGVYPLSYDDPYWSLFRDFVEQMEKVEQTFRYSRQTFRF